MTNDDDLEYYNYFMGSENEEQVESNQARGSKAIEAKDTDLWQAWGW